MDLLLCLLAGPRASYVVWANFCVHGTAFNLVRTGIVRWASSPESCGLHELKLLVPTPGFERIDLPDFGAPERHPVTWTAPLGFKKKLLTLGDGLFKQRARRGGGGEGYERFFLGFILRSRGSRGGRGRGSRVEVSPGHNPEKHSIRYSYCMEQSFATWSPIVHPRPSLSLPFRFCVRCAHRLY